MRWGATVSLPRCRPPPTSGSTCSSPLPEMLAWGRRHAGCGDCARRDIGLTGAGSARSVKAQFKSADRSGARAVAVVGDEWDAGEVRMKNMTSGEDTTVRIEEVGEYDKMSRAAPLLDALDG